MKELVIKIDDDGYPEWSGSVSDLSTTELERIKVLVIATINNRKVRIPDKNGHVCKSFISIGDGVATCTECDRAIVTDVKRFIRLVAEPLEVQEVK
jgi:uncharacterized ubiquitin-like protein YukD